MFLKAIARQTPEVLTELRNVLPIYDDISEDLLLETSQGPRLVGVGNPVEFFFGAPPSPVEKRLPNLLLWRNVRHQKHVKEVCKLRAAILAWAVRFKLRNEWLLDRALQSLYQWRCRPRPTTEIDPHSKRGPRILYVSDWGGLPGASPFLISASERKFVYEDEGWGLEFETWEEFDQRLRTTLNARLKSYKRQLLKLAEIRGFPKLEYRPEHFDWLALYHIRGLSPAKLLEQTNKHDTDESTALKAIQKLAKAIDLRLRVSRKGRTRS